MKAWSAERVASAAQSRLVGDAPAGGGPERVVIDSREAGPGALFVGLQGTSVDGGEFAAQAFERGAWGVMVGPEHASAAQAAATGAVLVADAPLRALQRLATAWRRELGAQVIGVTGSTGKTSTKDLLLAVLAPQRRTVASRANYNTEIGLPLEILAAPAETQVLVLEMAMRGTGQIAELAAIAEPDVGVIVSVGPVHLELLGSVEAVAAAKAELLAALYPGATAVVPAGESLLEPHLRPDLETLRFGAGGDVRLTREDEDTVEIDLAGELIGLEVSFAQAHLRRNLLAAVAAARAVGVVPSGRVELALSPGRGERKRLPGDVTLIDDCYNANPMSVRAALEDLALTARADGPGRRLAVLGDMLELGPDERRFHEDLAPAANRAADVLVTVGALAEAIADGFDKEVHAVADAPEAARLLESLVRPGDVILVKGSRAVGLELVCRALREAAPV
jgi:UDP-N-acetylmuramoyl-tripeptide--D-alanyl-D-alanine ligase